MCVPLSLLPQSLRSVTAAKATGRTGGGPRAGQVAVKQQREGVRDSQETDANYDSGLSAQSKDIGGYKQACIRVGQNCCWTVRV